MLKCFHKTTNKTNYKITSTLFNNNERNNINNYNNIYFEYTSTTTTTSTYTPILIKGCLA
jgi:hypothetical protein